MKEFFFSLTFSSFSTCISVSSLLHPSPGQQLFFFLNVWFCAATCWTSCLRVSQRVTVLIQIKAYLRRTFQGRSSSVVKLCWRRKKTQTSAADRWSCFNQTACNKQNVSASAARLPGCSIGCSDLVSTCILSDRITSGPGVNTIKGTTTEGATTTGTERFS